MGRIKGNGEIRTELLMGLINGDIQLMGIYVKEETKTTNINGCREMGIDKKWE